MRCSCPNTIYCIMPPQILRRLAEEGTDEQRRDALRSLALGETIRNARVQAELGRAAAPRPRSNSLAKLRGPAAPNRIIRDAENTENLQGRVVRTEGQGDTNDEAVDEAYGFFGDTFKFFFDVYGRNSIDDAGMPLRGVVHFGERLDNAFWTDHEMVFGDGGSIFHRLTMSLDVIGHELGHGVVGDEGPLEYMGMSGALNESMADVFGSLVKQYTLDQSADKADWLIGAEVMRDEFGEALRSLKAPGKAWQHDDQPAHMDDFVETLDDNGGVHINSGIPNHAFYTVATTLGGNAWEAPGRIWYETLQHPRLYPRSSFRRFARISHRVARSLYGAGSNEVAAVEAGWQKVGLHAALVTA